MSNKNKQGFEAFVNICQCLWLKIEQRDIPKCSARFNLILNSVFTSNSLSVRASCTRAFAFVL